MSMDFLCLPVRSACRSCRAGRLFLLSIAAVRPASLVHSGVFLIGQLSYAVPVFKISARCGAAGFWFPAGGALP